MMRFFKYTALAAFAFIFIGFSAGQANAQLQSILTRMNDHNKVLSSLKANVTMVKYQDQLETRDTTKGKVMYLPRTGKDPLVRLDWNNGDALAVGNKKYILYKPGTGQAITGSTEKAKGSAKAGNALAFMSMTRAQLRENYTVTFIGGDEKLSDGTVTDHIKLEPKMASNYISAEVWVDANGMVIQSKVTEKNNDTTTILLTNIVKNQTLNAKDFQIILPKGTKEVKS
jgi:outer membrane lipoprotein-sorting protein